MTESVGHKPKVYVFSDTEQEIMLPSKNDLFEHRNFRSGGMKGKVFDGASNCKEFPRYKSLQFQDYGSDGMKVCKRSGLVHIDIDVLNNAHLFIENGPFLKFSNMARDAICTDRERYRREKHNKIEKKRRSFINDSIYELANLIPERSSFSLKKGSILEDTVDYVKKLQRKVEQAKQLQLRVSELEIEFRKMSVRLKQVESRPSFNDGEFLEENKYKKNHKAAALEFFFE